MAGVLVWKNTVGKRGQYTREYVYWAYFISI